MATIEIKLTEEQRKQVIEGKKNLLEIEMKEKIEQIKNEYEEKISSLKLNDEYKTTVIFIDDKKEISKKNTETTKNKKKLTDEELTKMFNDGKEVKEMAELTGKKETAIRTQLNKLNLKLKDRK